MTQEFVHLRLHSEYSLVDGLVRLKPLAQKVAELKMPAVALTDFNNFFGLVKFYKACQSNGIKPILGSEVIIQDDVEETGGSQLVLLICNDIGYKNLTELISRAYQEGQKQSTPTVKLEWLEGHSDGLIALSGGRLGEIGIALISGRKSDAENSLARLMRLFPQRFYLELQRTGRQDEEDYLHSVIELSANFDCPVVATNDVRFLIRDEFEAHEARVCIHEGRTLDDPRRERRFSEDQYLRSAEEMFELFSDIPEALENTIEIAKRCNLNLKLGSHFLPDYPIPGGLTIEEFFKRESYDGLNVRLENLFDSSASNFEAKSKL